MNTTTHTLLPKNEKELFIKIVLLSTIAIGAFSNIKNKSAKMPSIKINNIYNTADNFSDFDQAHIPNKTPVIAEMISVLKPGFSIEKRNEFAVKIHKALAKYKIEPQIVVAIIDAESDFNHEMVSSTGDLSMAQINVDIWNKEFERMNMKTIEAEKIKVDESYSLEVMAQILHILKTRYEKKDRRWYARYHSKTQKHKRAYMTKLSTRLNLLEKSRVAILH